jgi:hypothetical protein
MAYYKLEPFGEERADLRAALICYVLACINSPKGKKPKITDFLLDFDKAASSKEPQSPAMMRAILEGIAATSTLGKAGVKPKPKGNAPGKQ